MPTECPNTCPRCGDSPRRDAVLPGAPHQQRFLCGSYIEDVSGVEEFGQSPLCAYKELLSLRSELASLRGKLAEAEKDNDAGRELMRAAWREFNAIRARDGAPVGVCHEYWNQLTEQLRELLGDDDAKPWMTKAATVMVKPWENRNAHLSSEVVDLELKLTAATSRAERAEAIVNDISYGRVVLSKDEHGWGAIRGVMLATGFETPLEAALAVHPVAQPEEEGNDA